MSRKKYDYHPDDKKLGYNIHYYPDLLTIARKEGYDCVEDAVRGLHAKFEGNARMVSEVFGVCRESALKWFKRLGLPINPRGGYRSDLDHRRQELLAMPTSELKGRVPTLAREWGISKQTMYGWLYKKSIRKGI